MKFSCMVEKKSIAMMMTPMDLEALLMLLTTPLQSEGIAKGGRSPTKTPHGMQGNLTSPVL